MARSFGIALCFLPTTSIASDCAKGATISFLLEDAPVVDFKTQEKLTTLDKDDDLGISRMGFVQDCSGGAALLSHEVFDFVIVPSDVAVFSEPITGAKLSGLSVPIDAAGSGFFR